MGEKYIPVVIVIILQRIITLQRKTCVNSYTPPRNSLSYESLPPSCFRKISAVLGRLKCPEFLAMMISCERMNVLDCKEIVGPRVAGELKHENLVLNELVRVKLPR